MIIKTNFIEDINLYKRKIKEVEKLILFDKLSFPLNFFKKEFDNYYFLHFDSFFEENFFKVISSTGNFNLLSISELEHSEIGSFEFKITDSTFETFTNLVYADFEKGSLSPDSIAISSEKIIAYNESLDFIAFAEKSREIAVVAFTNDLFKCNSKLSNTIQESNFSKVNSFAEDDLNYFKEHSDNLKELISFYDTLKENYNILK